MNGFRFSAALGAALACVALSVSAQGTSVDPKDAQPIEAKKAPPKKAPAKKAPAKKRAPAKAAKKVDSKPIATGGGGTVQKYEAGKAPELRDSKGNVVPTAPDAYDVSSATQPAKKK